MIVKEFWILNKRYTNKLKAEQRKYPRPILGLSKRDDPKCTSICGK
jgi:hypothetical protein